MNLTGMLYGSKLLSYVGFPTAEVLGPEAGEEEMMAEDEACAYGGLLKSVEAVDDMTVKFELCTPDVAFPSKVAFTAFNIHPSEYLKATGSSVDIVHNPIGTGP